MKIKLPQQKTDMDRILSIPMFHMKAESTEAGLLAEKWTRRLRVPGGDWILNAPQGLALEMIEGCRALFGVIGVGVGKTLIGLTAPRAMGMGPYETVVLVPSAIRNAYPNEAMRYLQQFDIETKLHIVGYSEISDHPYLLRRLKPKLIIADEVHNVFGDTARTQQFHQYFDQHPETKLIAMTGTGMKKSINDFYPVVKRALHDFTPLPIPWTNRQQWARCLDVSSAVTVPMIYEWKSLQPLVSWYCALTNTPLENLAEMKHPGKRKELARKAFSYRLGTTPGIILTERSSGTAKTLMRRVTNIELPKELDDVFKHLTKTWDLPNGHEIEDQLRLASAKRQLSCGFYYYPDWKDKPDRPWIYARRDWLRARSAIIKKRKDLFSPSMVMVAMTNGGIPREKYPKFWEAWDAWSEQKHKDEPPRATEWVSDYFIHAIVEQVSKSNEPTLIFVQSEALRNALRKYYRVIQPGTVPDLTKGETIVVTLASHGTGLNFQHEWRRMVVCEPPANGHQWEQLIGRINRQGQKADTVEIVVFEHTEIFKSAMRSARLAALAANQNQKTPQMLLNAEIITEDSC